MEDQQSASGDLTQKSVANGGPPFGIPQPPRATGRDRRRGERTNAVPPWLTAQAPAG